jgi:aspartate/tyrosine/aromatic aminotransferase
MTIGKSGVIPMPFFNDIPQLPDDPILGLPQAFAADPRPHKINLGIGSYKTAEGQPLVLTSVRKAESLLLQKHLNKEYLPIEGDADFLRCALPLLLGPDSPLWQSGNFFAAQSVGGASALRIGGEFLAKLVSKTIFSSQPSWSNHKQIFERAGLNVGSYPYCNPKTCLFDYQGMCDAIKNMPPGSVILLHGCCHNPTGIDPTFEQWKELSDLIKKQQLIPFFDIAYQGFGQDLDLDAQAIRYFVNEGHEMLIAYSFSKNFGLYGERVGFLTVVCSTAERIPKIGSQIKSLIRANYSNPPLHGARIVSTILKSHELTLEWKTELSNMRERVKEMRKALIAALLVKGQDRNFAFMHQQNGLFSFLGINPEQVQYLRKEKAIYMPNSGRINIAGLNTQNISDVAEALLSVM